MKTTEAAIFQKTSLEIKVFAQTHIPIFDACRQQQSCILTLPVKIGRFNLPLSIFCLGARCLLRRCRYALALLDLIANQLRKVFLAFRLSQSPQQLLKFEVRKDCPSCRLAVDQLQIDRILR